MRYQTLISPDQAAPHLDEEGWAFVDCRTVLGQPDRGRADYLEAHLPGAVHADLERDLSGPVRPGRTGRHPLPARDALTAALSRLGIDADTQVVAYDEQSGAMAAARLWWLLRWAGHDAVAVLDGGLRAWTAAGYATTSGADERPARTFTGEFNDALAADATDVLGALGGGELCLVDARASDRYAGRNETVDPVAGHLPGARSLPYLGNLDPDGRFRSRAELAARYAAVTDPARPEGTVFYCGSGVTAAHNVLAQVHAGLGMPRLYPGSWSDWITDPDRPIATGDATA